MLSCGLYAKFKLEDCRSALSCFLLTQMVGTANFTLTDNFSTTFKKNNVIKLFSEEEKVWGMLQEIHPWLPDVLQGISLAKSSENTYIVLKEEDQMPFATESQDLRTFNSWGLQGTMKSYFQALTLDGVKLNKTLRAMKERERRKSSCISLAADMLIFSIFVLKNALKAAINISLAFLCRSNMGSSQNRCVSVCTWGWEQSAWFLLTPREFRSTLCGLWQAIQLPHSPASQLHNWDSPT